MRGLFLLAVGAIAPLAIACGPSKVQVSPADVTRVDIRPASGQALFCPGDPFQVELLVQTKGGGPCSSTDRALGCMGKSDAVLDPSTVHVEAWPAQVVGGADFTFSPDPNPLATAGTGVLLQGWLESAGQKSMVGKSTLKPVYACQAQQVIARSGGLDWGSHGAAGPELHVFITTLSTPFYANAALIRMEAPELGLVRYAISPSADKPVTIVARGQDGAPGMPGALGQAGKKGSDGSGECSQGGRGGDGGPGGLGGPGGDGGPGAVVHLHADAAASEALMARVRITNPGGSAGHGGNGGVGGEPGAGGAAGPSGKSCFGKVGEPGTRGANGPAGPPGHPGASGPTPTLDVAPRATLFPKELSTIMQVEATPAPK